MPTVSRRRFLQVLGALGLSQAAGVQLGAQPGPQLPPEPEYRAQPQPRGLRPTYGAYTFFNLHEARFVEAAVSRIIPDDELGPGALEAAVPLFIDRQLQSQFGLAATWYMQGPWQDGTEQQGYQLPLTPQEVYRSSIAALDAHAEETYGAVFAELADRDKDAILTALEAGEVDVPPLPKRILDTFWGMLLDNTKEGYFSDPAYGGNHDKVGWRLVGFPGVAAAYRGALEAYYGRPYRVDPVSIVDIHSGLAEVDGSGHAVHRDLLTGRVLTEVQHDHPERGDHEH